MGIYTINGTPFSDFGITISMLSGFEKLPKRKKPTEKSWPDENGVEPFVDASDIVFEARDIDLNGNLLADTVELAKAQFQDFQDLLYQSGELDFEVDYLSRTFVVYTKDAVIGKRIGDVNGQVAYQLVIKLREIDPTNVTIV